jgi:Arc/MetJ-type ribon-helix-helix transcriptional regulator
MSNEKATIKIPRRLYLKIQHLITDSGFNSATDFIVYILRDVLSEAPGEDHEEFSTEELKALKQKLKNLGYLD